FGDFHYDIISFFFSSRRRHTRSKRDWSSDVCSSDLFLKQVAPFFHDAPYLHYEHELTYLQLDQSLPLLITSFPIRDLPTSFSYTRNSTFMGKFTETNSAQSKFANNRMRTTTTFTTCIFTYFKFLFTFLFSNYRFFGHSLPSLHSLILTL